MDHRITYTDRTTTISYSLLYDDDDPAVIEIVGPAADEGIRIPFQAVDFLMMAYRMHVVQDIFEHRPVKGN